MKTEQELKLEEYAQKFKPKWVYDVPGNMDDVLILLKNGEIKMAYHKNTTERWFETNGTGIWTWDEVIGMFDPRIIELPENQTI